MPVGINNTKKSTGPTNQWDAQVASFVSDNDTVQVQAIQNGETQRNADSENGKTTRHAAKERGETTRHAATRRSKAIMAGVIAVPAAVGLTIAGGMVSNVMSHGIDAQAATDQANANRVSVQTGDRNMCNTVIVLPDGRTVDIGQGNPNDPHMNGDAIADLIANGKAIGAEVVVGDTNEATVIMTMDKEGNLTPAFIPEACEQPAGEVFNSPKVSAAETAAEAPFVTSFLRKLQLAGADLDVDGPIDLSGLSSTGNIGLTLSDGTSPTVKGITHDASTGEYSITIDGGKVYTGTL